MSSIAISNILIFAALVLFIPVVVAVYVYRDADRRGMSALLWAVVAALAPSFIGLIIYLLVRGNYSDLHCPRCEAPVTRQFVVCPKCGVKLRPVCPNCDTPVEQDWKVCPKCAQPLPETQSDCQSPVKGKDRSLGRVLAIVLIVPVLLIGLALFSFGAISGGGSTTSRECTFDEYAEEMKEQGSDTIGNTVRAWIDSLQVEDNHAYALRYDYEAGGEYYYLIYTPGTGNAHRRTIGQSSGIFGTTVKLTLYSTGDNGSVLNIVSSAKKAPNLVIEVDGKKIPCDVTVVDYNPTVYHIFPQQNATAPAAAK